MKPYRTLRWAAKRDFPAEGGEHFYGSGRKTFSCEVNIDGPQPLMREKFKLHCSLYLPDGTESRGLLDDAAWSWEVAGQHGASKHDFISLPATLTFNFKKATGKLIMINICVLDVDNDPNMAQHIACVNTSTFWVKSKRRLSSDAPPCKNETGMKRSYSESSEQSQSCEGSIETICKWTEIAMSTMNRVKRSRSTEDSDKDILRDAMSQCHLLRVYEALDALRQQDAAAKANGDFSNCISADDEDLQQLLMEFWDEAVAGHEQDQLKEVTGLPTMIPETNSVFPPPVSESFKALACIHSAGPPPMNRIYSEGSSKGRVINQFIERLRPLPI